MFLADFSVYGVLICISHACVWRERDGGRVTECVQGTESKEQTKREQDKEEEAEIPSQETVLSPGGQRAQ